MSGRRRLQLIVLLLAPSLAGAAEPFVEDRTLENGVRVVLAPLASEPLEVRAYGGRCPPCVDHDASQKSLSWIASRTPTLIVIAGQFDLDTVRGLVEEQLADLPAREIAKPRAAVERYTRRPGDRARIAVALHSAVRSANDAWAIVVAHTLLAIRLDRRHIGGPITVEWHRGELVVKAELADAAAREALDEELQRLAREPLTAHELDLAIKMNGIAPPSRATRLADLTLACGNPRLIRDADADVKKVSPADVQHAAQRLADRAHRSTVETFVAARAALSPERGAPKVP